VARPRLTLSLQRGRLRALVTTGTHRYASDGRYVAARRQLLLTVRTSGGIVRLQATLGAGSVGAARMLGIWSDAHDDESDVDCLSPRTTLAGSRARVTVQPGAWLPFFPQRFLTRIYAKNGASRRMPLSLSQLMLAVMQEMTARAPQFTGTGFATPPYGADVATNQRTMPRWMATYLPLPGLEIAPIAAGVGAGYGVVIYAHNHLGQGEDTRVLDTATVLAIVNGNGPSPVPLVHVGSNKSAVYASRRDTSLSVVCHATSVARQLRSLG